MKRLLFVFLLAGCSEPPPDPIVIQRLKNMMQCACHDQGGILMTRQEGSEAFFFECRNERKVRKMDPSIVCYP